MTLKLAVSRSRPPVPYGANILIFQDDSRPPSLIFKSWKFYVLDLFGGPTCVTVPNFVLISQTVAEISRFSDVLDGVKSFALCRRGKFS